MGGCGLDSSGSVQGPVAGPFAHGHESSGQTQSEEFIDQLTEYWFLKKDSGPWGGLVGWLVS
jgi:hypothetical protein